MGKNDPRNKKNSDKRTSEFARQNIAGKATNMSSDGMGQKQVRSDVCFNCWKPGHIVKYCYSKKIRREAGAEATRKSSQSNKVLSTVADMVSDQQLEQELASCKLNREQSLITNPKSSSLGTMNAIEGAETNPDARGFG